MIEYQYSTNPKKHYPNYSNAKESKENKLKNKKKKDVKNSYDVDAKVNKTSKAKKAKTFSKNTNELLQAKKKLRNEKRNEKIFIGFFIILAIFLSSIIVYRNSYADEKFMEVNKKTKQIEEMKKENEQLKLSLQNSLSLNKIEDKAKKIGMQKLDSSKIIKVSLPKKDFIEPSEKATVFNKKESVFNKLYKQFMRLI